MTSPAKTLLLSLSVAAVAAACVIPAANAATDTAGGKFTTFEATPKAPRIAVPKAPRVEPEQNRQIVVEPRQQTPTTPVASLNPPVEEIESAAAKPPQTAPDVEPAPEQEAANEPTATPETQEDVFAPQTAKVEMPTVFTPKQEKLFKELSTGEQKQLVTKLIGKYGYDTMYPRAKVSRKYLDDYKSKQSAAATGDRYSYQDTGYNDNYNYQTTYGSGYANCQ